YGADPNVHRFQTGPDTIYFGRLIARGNREVVQTYNLKKRAYLGTTSMDAELSLVMANQALARPGALVYDPFVGTGSFLLTCAHFGAFTMGSDIDGRQIRGSRKPNTSGIRTNVTQYNLGHRVLDTVVFDLCRNPWREADVPRPAPASGRGGPWFDAIVTDPPYGVRAGAKRLGRKTGLVPEHSFKVVEGTMNHLRHDYYPPTVPYEMSEVLTDLLEFAARHLVVGGRLVYWLPTIVDEYTPNEVPTHPCLQLMANSEQPFGSWSRRLITMEKTRDWEPILDRATPHYVVPPAQTAARASAMVASTDDSQTVAENVEPSSDAASEEVSTPKSQAGHFNFREKYFAKPDETSPQ
ncbi:hypothetical protein IWQ60_009426, partial [Tieghemiomyces parasiticus]